MNPLSFPRKRESCKKVQATAKAGQAAIELAVFGAILVFILGTIVRSAVGNGYAQNENFKAMRMAMLASWKGTSIEPPGPGALANISHNSASILFVEDRLSPDFNKYGDVDRNPFIAQGSGTFSYNLFYPWQPGVDPVVNLIPIMDVWINGQHFPFTTATYTSQTITRLTSCSSDCQASSPQQQQCLQNQINRNQREWAGGTIDKSQFYSVIPGTLDQATIVNDVNAIFNELVNEGNITLIGTQGASVNSSTLSSAFTAWLEATISGTGQAQVDQIQNILQSNQTQYKLFYTMQVNGTPQFSPAAPSTCSGKDNALCTSLTLPDANGSPYLNSSGDMQYDLQRLGYYTTPPPTCASSPCESVDQQFPYTGLSSCADSSVAMRCYVAWQWAATPGTTAASIGLDTTSNVYPNYDIDGRLKTVTIYGISGPSNSPTVTYEDYQGGDIDGAWDSNSCGPKPGLQSGSQIFTFTKEGTYLIIKEGKLYNPETDQFVRSQNKRDTVDLIQRTIQLSNNNGRFCPVVNGGASFVAPATLSDGTPNNPVEICVPTGSSDNCFSSEQNIKSTCFDENDNMIFVRSRLEDRRGHFWMTDASGQLQVK